tara:strand:- start:2120 stop:2530 length:411 start_codon:yes stop_codon:yes gene_type:complete
MKFKITEVTTTSVKAEYEDGSWALVPVTKGQDQATIYDLIHTYGNKSIPFDKVSDVPVTISSNYIDASPEIDPTVSYEVARDTHYPPVGDQLDALYWAREGDDTNLKAVDEAIKTVKTKIPKGSTYKTSELSTLLD